MATPMLHATSRCGSRVEFSAITANTTSPSCRYLRPSRRGIILHCGGKIEETRTRFCEAMPASRRASSNDVNRSLCLPTPLVKNSFFGTMLFPNFYVPSVGVKFVADFERTRMSLSHLGGHEQGLATNLSALHSGGPARKTKPAQPVVPVESPRSLPLATLAGNLSP